MCRVRRPTSKLSGTVTAPNYNPFFGLESHSKCTYSPADWKIKRCSTSKACGRTWFQVNLWRHYLEYDSWLLTTRTYQLIHYTQFVSLFNSLNLFMIEYLAHTLRLFHKVDDTFSNGPQRQWYMKTQKMLSIKIRTPTMEIDANLYQL